MSVELILGRAGSGKTEACIEQIRQGLTADTDEEFVLLTPEQATFTNEKRILASLGNTAGFRVKVLSFRRFVHWVLQETGGGLHPTLDAVGKSMVLRSILERNRDNLCAFGRVWNKSGFVRRMADIMDEFRTYQINLDDRIDKIGSAWPGNDLAAKISDIHRVLTEYERFLARGWLDMSGELALLCQKLPVWPRLAKVRFWLDGFHGFTPAEFGVIRGLLTAGRQVKVTLTLPVNEMERGLEEEDLFYPTWETAMELQKMCHLSGFEMSPPLCMGEPGEMRFVKSSGLARLERAIAVPGAATEDWDNTRAGVYSEVHLAGCGDMRQEVERLAVEILEAAREEKLRYNEMAVLIRHPDAYESLIHSILPSYGIPYFLDRPKSLRYHPLMVLLKELTVFIGDRWNTGTLMACIKTGMAGLTDNQGYALENYCLAWGIRRMHWESPRPWSFTSPQEPDHTAIDSYMEHLRQIVWAPLVALRNNMEKAVTTEEIVTGVYHYLIGLKADKACIRMEEDAERRGEPEAARIHKRAWQELMRLFDQTVTFLGQDEGGEAFSVGNPLLIAAIWESGLEALEMAAVPPALDQVTVCSMDRSRSPLASKVWILGANEGVIPANIKDDSLLSMEERKWLADIEIRLAPDSRRRMFSEEYLVYIALTRASGSLHISYARGDMQGASRAPSALLDRICRILPDVHIDEADLNVVRKLVKPTIALPYLGLALRNGDFDWREVSTEEGKNAEDGTGIWNYVFQWFYNRVAYKRDLARMKAAYYLAPLGQSLPSDLAEQLFGRTIKTSVTRLEQFQACPFSHFLGYGLALEPRDIYEIQPPEIGTFFHDSLEALLKDVMREGLSLHVLDREELDRKVEMIAERQLNDEKNKIFRTSAWYSRLSLNLRRILKSSAAALAWQEDRGVFRPHALEVGFGFDDAESLPPVTLDVGYGRKILLRGRIDRVDQAADPQSGETYIRVIDYKSGNLDLSLNEIYHGLKLQLILYLEAARTAYVGAKAAGMFYYRVHDPILTADTVPEAYDQTWRETRIIEAQGLKGYLLNNHKVIQMMDKAYESSLFLPIGISKSGEFDKRSKVLDEEDFRLVGEHSRRMLNKAGQRIVEGDISLTPYQTKGKSACTYCLYRSVCRFDTTVSGHSYRWIPGVSDDAVLERLKANMGEGRRI